MNVMVINNLSSLRRYCVQASGTFYATTPIFYVNAAPHIGHLYSAVIADALSRYQRLRQPQTQVHLCTGTDEHGTKIQQAAAAQSVPVAQYCDEISGRYRQVFKEVGIANTDFIRTTEQRHKQAVAQFWRTLHKLGHIYSAAYSGWYCVSDETFLTDSQLRLDTATGARFSLESGHPVEWTEETNYMFRLSEIQENVIYWVKKGGHVRPKKFEKILLDMLSESLPDVSVSRPANRVHWAIPVPDDETQTVYVWLDALINYLTSAGYPDKKYRKFWPPNVQVIGKDILKFHGIYWPAFLIAAGLEPPQQLFVHSHWTVDGQKMSKSKHNVVDPVASAKTYTMEGLRYFLLREGVAHSDGNFSHVKALRILNSELADTLGNLLSRACAKSLNPQQVYPRLHAVQVDDLLRMDAAKRLQDALQQIEARCAQHYADNNFYLVVDTVISTLHAANNFFETSRPWELKRPAAAVTTGNDVDAANTQNIENFERLETIIAMTMDTLRICGIVLQPIVPQLCGKLLDKLAVPQEQRLWRNLDDCFATKSSNENVARPLDVHTDAVLFRRILLKEEDLQAGPPIKSPPVPQTKEKMKQKQKEKTAKSKTAAQ
ncbi:PREDICTED: methionine--tRNA ligase, mitochondrial isoform X1 [Rhagoletis zephyria]|uniref:methionine--tRNA ligase, mitochondrial isoform X1 n=1 Tax=Rhagoletis zephyria TaxID=28612 RepID=UPI0008114A2A|nr:PREDICTED: methionine--tRNA ligase, mitochondrial isoform X1 [Rhagoletis zephyria]